MTARGENRRKVEFGFLFVLFIQVNTDQHLCGPVPPINIYIYFIIPDVSDEEIKGAEEKFAESLYLAQMGMFNLLDNDVSILIQNTRHK